MLVSTVPHSNMALEDLTGLEAILCLKGSPSTDGACLDTQHLLVAVLGSIVANGLSTLLPGVPDNSVVEVVSDDVVAWLSVNEN